jgi:biofilm protein TabA
MVADHVNHASEYFNLNPRIRLALEYLRRIDAGALEVGRHDVDGDRVFALVSDYLTRRPEDAFWEAHRRHIDVQYVHAGRERIGYGPLSGFECDPYDDDRDLQVARGSSERSIDVTPGGFVILFPHEAHMPGLTAQAVEAVRKVVVKVRL